MLKLATLLKEGQTYQIFPAWGSKESYYVKVAAPVGEIDTSQYSCRVHDDLCVIELRRRKARTIYLPYHSIRYIEVSPAADVVEKLFG